MICNQDSPGRLYLSKGTQNIYIDSCKLPQHHIDGIRFLYKQYKKQKSGVIINYRPGYGSILQIVLFIKAVRCLLNKPVLVLCKDGVETIWMEHFETWTDFCDEVVLETQKPFIKKLVLINTMSNLTAFSRHEWSLVVVDGDDSYALLKHSFRADFKIYMTSADMKDNLDKFTQIYEWLYPGEAKEKNKWKFNKSDFIADRENPMDVVEKAILLDAFMEDIVASNEEADNSREDHDVSRYVTGLCTSITASRKNKDATGTKIKRSKRKMYDDDNDDNIPFSKSKKDSVIIPKEVVKSCNENNTTVCASNNNDTIEDFSIENFESKRNKNTHTDGGQNFQISGIQMDTSNSQSQLDLYYEPDSVTDMNSDKYYEMDTLEFSNDSREYQYTNVNNPIQVTNNDLDGDGGSKENSLRADEETCSQIGRETESDIHYEILSKNIDSNKISKLNEQIVTEKSPSICHEMNADKDEFKINVGTPSIEGIEDDFVCEDSQSICNGMNLANEMEMSRELQCNGISTKNEPYKGNENLLDISEGITKRESSAIVESKQKELDENVIEVSKKSVTPVANLLKHNCFEDKLKDMEEKALKKFKGSILDNLF